MSNAEQERLTRMGEWLDANADVVIEALMKIAAARHEEAKAAHRDGLTDSGHTYSRIAERWERIAGQLAILRDE